MLTAKQHELLVFINQRLDESGISPSFEEMKEALDLKSKSGVHRLIGALEERGLLRVCRLKRWKVKVPCRCRWRCWALASIMRWKFPATR